MVHFLVNKVMLIPSLQNLRILLRMELRLAPIVLEGLLRQWRAQRQLDSIALVVAKGSSHVLLDTLALAGLLRQ